MPLAAPPQPPGVAAPRTREGGPDLTSLERGEVGTALAGARSRDAGRLRGRGERHGSVHAAPGPRRRAAARARRESWLVPRGPGPYPAPPAIYGRAAASRRSTSALRPSSP